MRTFDAADNLLSVTTGIAAQHSHPATTAYQYDALNRVTKTTNPRGYHQVTHYDGNDNVIAVTVDVTSGTDLQPQTGFAMQLNLERKWLGLQCN